MSIWRDGDCIVIHQSGQFPNRCIVTNRPAGRRISQWIPATLPTIEHRPQASFTVDQRLAIIGPVIDRFRVVRTVIATGLQPRRRLRIPLCRPLFKRYRQRQRRIISGTAASVTIGMITSSGIGQFSEPVNTTLQLVASSSIGAGLLIGSALWLMQPQFVSVVWIENDFLWLRVRGQPSALLPDLPAWNAQFPPTPPPRRWRTRLKQTVKQRIRPEPTGRFGRSFTGAFTGRFTGRFTGSFTGRFTGLKPAVLKFKPTGLQQRVRTWRQSRGGR